MRIAGQEGFRRGQAALGERVDADLAAFLVGAADIVQLQRALHNRPDGIAGGEGVEGILEHRLHQAVELLRVGFQQLLGGNAVKVDLAAGGFLQPDQQPAQCGLAAAAFADDAENLPFL